MVGGGLCRLGCGGRAQCRKYDTNSEEFKNVDHNIAAVHVGQLCVGQPAPCEVPATPEELDKHSS